MFCSGTFPVLKLVSSRIFGLSIFETGLLSSELRELSKIKIRCTIYFENIPQLIIQLIYLQLHGPQIETILAMLASLLSVSATLIVYWGERDLTKEYAITKYFIRLYTHGTVNKEVKLAMINNRKKRRGLTYKLAEVFGGAPKQIELGSIMLLHDGVAIHVQHLIFSKQLDEYRRQRNQYNITVEVYMEHIFRKKIRKVLDAVWTHFRLDKTDTDRREFTVSFQLELENGSADSHRHLPGLGDRAISFNDRDAVEMDGTPHPRRRTAVSFCERDIPVATPGSTASPESGGGWASLTGNMTGNIQHAIPVHSVEMTDMTLDGDFGTAGGEIGNIQAMLRQEMEITRKRYLMISRLLAAQSGASTPVQSDDAEVEVDFSE